MCYRGFLAMLWAILQVVAREPTIFVEVASRTITLTVSQSGDAHQF
jgi:hypothetical protein